MSFREIKPTKTNLINLKKRARFAERSESFLEYKREQLIRQIRDSWQSFLEKRKTMLKSYRSSLFQLNQVYKEMGKRKVNMIGKVSNIQYDPEIEIKHKKDMGILLADISSKLMEEDHLPSYSFSTSHHLDSLTEMIKEFFQKIIELAISEDAMLKLSFSYNKISRRINGLKNVIIPRIDSDIKKITEVLEENQRESFIRLKKTKELIEKKNLSSS